jgi:hypothetical protein
MKSTAGEERIYARKNGMSNNRVPETVYTTIWLPVGINFEPRNGGE